MKRKLDSTLEDTPEPLKAQKLVQNRLKTSSSLYNNSFPYYRQPAEIGRFSLDADRKFKHDSSQLRAFAPPRDWNNCAFDLKEGYEAMIKRDEETTEYLDNLLRWIMLNKDKFLLRPNSGDKGEGGEPKVEGAGAGNMLHRLNTDFVCWRGLLSRLLCLPYENREELVMAVILYRGTYFMCEYDSEYEKQRKEQATARDKEMCAWGFKFEQFVTAESGKQQPTTQVPVNSNNAFCVVSRTRLESHSIVFGAETDCEDRNIKSGNRYVELKTSRLISSSHQFKNFCRFKLLHWWTQSFLAGVPNIVCGFRDDNGIVKKLKNYSVSDIPSTVKRNLNHPWKAEVCFNFLNSFLKFVKSNVQEDNPRCVYVLRWKPYGEMTCEQRLGDPEFLFLPQWFTEWTAWDSTDPV